MLAFRRPKTISGELGRFFKDFTSAPDRGKSFYQQERQRYHLASLVEAGRLGPASLHAVDVLLQRAFPGCVLFTFSS